MASTESAVSAAVEALRRAMVAGDRSALDKLAVDELVYGHASGRVENKAAFIETLAGGKAGFEKAVHELQDALYQETA